MIGSFPPGDDFSKCADAAGYLHDSLTLHDLPRSTGSPQIPKVHFFAFFPDAVNNENAKADKEKTALLDEKKIQR